MKFRKRVPKGVISSGHYYDKETGDLILLYQKPNHIAVRIPANKKEKPCVAK